MYHEDEGLNYTFGGGKQPRGYDEYERTLNTEDDMAELAEWQYEHQAELDAEAGELVEAEIAENLTVRSRRMVDVLVAHNRQTGLFYARQFGMSEPPIIATRPEHLMGYSPPTTFIYINSDNADVVRQLLVLEACGCEVDWLGGRPAHPLAPR